MSSIRPPREIGRIPHTRARFRTSADALPGRGREENRGNSRENAPGVRSRGGHAVCDLRSAAASRSGVHGDTGDPDRGPMAPIRPIGPIRPIRPGTAMNEDERYRRYQELQQYVGWTDDDARRVRSVAALLEPHFPALIDDFYAEIERHSDARRVITGGAEQIQRLKGTLLG